MTNTTAWLLCDSCNDNTNSDTQLLPSAVFTSRKAILDYVKEHMVDVHGQVIVETTINPNDMQSPLSFDDAITLLDFLVGE